MSADAAAASAFQRTTLPGGVELCVLPTAKFKTVTVRVSLRENLDADAAGRSLLAGLVKRGSREWPEMMALARRLEELFGASLGADVSRLGEWQVSDFQIRLPHARFVKREGDALAQALDLLHGLLLDPPLDEGDGAGYRSDVFEEERKNLRRAIESLVDDKAAHAHQRLHECMFAGEPYARMDTGTLAEVEALDRRGVLALQRRRFGSADLAVFAVGDFDAADRATLQRFAARLGPRREPLALKQAEVRTPGAPVAVLESSDSAQSHLLIGFRFDPHGVTEREHYALGLMNGVLGTGAHSLLFKEVREKRSLAYTTGSFLDRQKGFLALYAGLDREQSDAATELMLAQVEAIAAGAFGDETFQAARLAVQHALRAVGDSAHQSIDFLERSRAVGRRQDPRAALEAVGALDRDDVSAAASRMQLSTTYLLRGDTLDGA